MKYNRFLVLFAPLAVFLFFELFFLNPKIFYFSLFCAIFIVFWSIKYLTKNSQVDKKWWDFSFLPVIFLLSSAMYSLIIPHRSLIQFLFVVTFIFLFIYFKSIYYYLIDFKKYKKGSLENLAFYGNFLVLFLVSSAAYGLQAFLSIPIWLLIITILPIIFLSLYNIMWANRIEFKVGFIYILIVSLILIELAWTISFLPINYNAVGLILAVHYYVLIGLLKFYLRGTLNKSIIKRYLGFGLASVIFILLSARWM